MIRNFAILVLLLISLPAAAGPHPREHHAPHWHTRPAPRMVHFAPRHHCWCWRGGVWVWVPIVQVQVGEGVWIDGQAYRITAPPTAGGVNICLGIEIWR